jgi:hypothetical protein
MEGHAPGCAATLKPERESCPSGWMQSGNYCIQMRGLVTTCLPHLGLTLLVLQNNPSRSA